MTDKRNLKNPKKKQSINNKSKAYFINLRNDRNKSNNGFSLS